MKQTQHTNEEIIELNEKNVRSHECESMKSSVKINKRGAGEKKFTKIASTHAKAYRGEKLLL